MATSNSSPIAARTRSNKSTSEHSPSHVPSLTAFQEINDNLSTMNVDTNENHPEQQIEEDEVQSSAQDKVQNIEDDKHSSYLNIQSTTKTFAKTENNEIKKEELINLPCTNEQLQHIQESFAAQLAQTQKIIENQ